jgi:glycosyltransferase involved in cell wall biosynthesis
VIPPEDPSALEAAIPALLAYPAERARLGANARAYAFENLDKETILGRF